MQRNSLYEIAKPILEDDKVVACGGQIAVSNGIRLVKGEVSDYSMPKKLIVAMQVLEYERSFLASRIFMNRYNGNLIISGAFGIFKKETVLLAGGYDDSTMGEDMELVVKLHVSADQIILIILYSMRQTQSAGARYREISKI